MADFEATNDGGDDELGELGADEEFEYQEDDGLAEEGEAAADAGPAASASAKAEAVERAAQDVNPELEKMREMVRRMEEEAGLLKAAVPLSPGSDALAEEKLEADTRSIYVGNCDYGAKPEELQAHFLSCGAINRVKINCDRKGNPLGFAYVEFALPESVEVAMALNETLFRGRLIKVTPKRTNLPGMGNKTSRPPRGGGFRGRGGFGRGSPRGRGGFRGRGRGGAVYFAPY